MSSSFSHWRLFNSTLLTQSERFALKFRFDGSYPFSAPAVQFVSDNKWKPPIHPVRLSTPCNFTQFNSNTTQHVYTNGHVRAYPPCGALKLISSSHNQICASILGNEWSPVLSVIAVCVTMQSMLASCRVSHPPGYMFPHRTVDVDIMRWGLQKKEL